MIYLSFSNNLQVKPNAPAIVMSDGKIYTYAMAEHLVIQLAHYLIQNGISEGDQVALILSKKEGWHVFFLLALDRINACYVPFDTDTPKRQLEKNITTLNLKKFIIEATLTTDFDVINPNIKLAMPTEEFDRIEAGDEQGPLPAYNPDAEGPLYIVFSSGSTSIEKKGIPIGRKGIKYWAEVENILFKPFPIDNVLATRSPAYDACISDYARAFGAGGTLHLLNHTQRKDMSSILEACELRSISCLLLIASQLGNENAERVIATLQRYGVKHLMVTGDTCTPYLKALCERYGINLWNCYGPTEATFGLSILRVNDLPLYTEKNQLIVPIGRPYGDDVHYHMIDGQLYIESPYMMDKYINPKHNIDAFKYIDKKRLFPTGDLFCEKNGFLYFQDREKFCKPNGVKVTPSSIQSFLNDYKIDSTPVFHHAVTVIKKYLGEDRIFAYVVINPLFDEATIRACFKDWLGDAERPILVPIDKIPDLWTSDKPDLQRLIALQDNPDTFFFNQGKSYQKKFSNDGLGISEESLNRINTKLADLTHLKTLSPSDLGVIIDEAVLSANHLDQQNDQYQLNQQEKQSRVLSLLEATYHQLICIYPCIGLLAISDEAAMRAILELPTRILSSLAQLLHYLGKARRYADGDIKIRMDFFEATLLISHFLDKHVPEERRAIEDPNYFTARIPTFRLPIIYNLKALGQLDLAIQLTQEQLIIARNNDDMFHVIQALVQLSDSYLQNNQIDLAFDTAQLAYIEVNVEHYTNGILFFNAQDILMRCASKKQDKTLALTLAKSVISSAKTSNISLKAHHLSSAKKILIEHNEDYISLLKKIWSEILQISPESIRDDAEFIELGGNSIKSAEMVYKIRALIEPSYNYEKLLALETKTISTIADDIEEFQKKPQKRIHSRAFIQKLGKHNTERGAIFCLPALLGEGYFSYIKLAQLMSHYFDRNIYGLSDPGIIDETQLPETMEQARDRYIAAIRSVQPHGPYELMGFSYGSFLAYEVAKELHKQGERVTKIHLLDGFPPHLYQTIDNNAHIEFLESLLNFIINVLNNSFYREELDPLELIKLEDFANLAKKEQVEHSFNNIESRIKHSSSKRLLLMAKRHLCFLLDAPEPTEKLPLWPTLYLSNQDLKYTKVIDKIPDISPDSADYKYRFWNLYFENMTCCGRNPRGGHLSFLDGYASAVNELFERAHDELFNIQIDHYGPLPFYRLEPTGLIPSHELSVFFVPHNMAHRLGNEFSKLGLAPTIHAYDKDIQKYEQRDTIYSSLTSVFLLVPGNKLNDVKKLLTSYHLNQNHSERSIQRPLLPTISGKNQGHIDLIVLRNRSRILTLSFNFDVLPSIIIEQLKRQLKLLPEPNSTSKSLIYKYQFVLFDTFYKAIEQVTSILTDFIAILQTNMNVNRPTEKPEIYPALHSPSFFKPKLSDLGLVIKRLVNEHRSHSCLKANVGACGGEPFLVAHFDSPTPLAPAFIPKS